MRTKLPPNKMGLWMLTALVAGNMIGSGIFLLPSNLAKIGSITLYSWLFTTIGAFLLALLFSRMSQLVTKAGGPYAYTRAAFGDFMGFQTAYSYWVTVWVGNAAIALAAIGYARVFWPALDNSTITCFATIALVWLISLINCHGAKTIGAFQLLTTICKIAPLLFIGIVGWWYFHPSYITQSFNLSTQSNFTAISNGAALTLWAFIGVESAVVGSDTVANPKRTIPLATLLGTLIAASVYIACSTVIMGMVPAAKLIQSASPFAIAAKQILGAWGAQLVAATAIISCVGALNGWVLLQGQVAMAAAEDRLFPKIFGVRNRHDIPAKGVIITSILISLLLFLTASPNLVKQFHLIILLAVLTALIPYFYTAMAAIIIMPQKIVNKKELHFSMVIAVLAGIYSFWTLLSSGKTIVFYGSILIFSSLPLYAWLRWHQNKGLKNEK